MLKSTVISISGLVIWYALKFVLLYSPSGTRKKLTSTFINLIPAVSVLSLSLVAWSRDECSQAIKNVGAAAVLISATSIAVEMMQLQKVRTPESVLPGHAACAVALSYLSGISIVTEPQTTCSAATILSSVVAGLILALHYLYLHKPCG